MKVILTGAAGFIGSHCLEYFLEKTDWKIFCIDSFRHKGTFSRLNEIVNYDPARVKIFNHDLTVPIDLQLENQLMERSIEGEEVPVDYIFNLASDSAVERSISDPTQCWRNNCELIINMLEFARIIKPKLFLQMSCYDEETRALTPSGFKKYNEIKSGDSILSLNKDTKELEIKTVEKVIVQYYNGPMYHFDYARTDIKVTPNHRMFYEKDSTVLVDEARKLVEKSYTYQLPRGKWKGIRRDKFYIKGIGQVDTKDLFYICGLYIGDGFTAYQEKKVVNKSGLNRENFLKKCRDAKGRFISTRLGKRKHSVCKSYRIYFDIPENDPCRSKLCDILTKWGVPFSCPKNKSGEHVYFSSKEWLNFFKQFGTYAQNKNIPDWMLEYDEEYLRALLEGLVDSDGNDGSTKTLSTCSPSLVRDACELGIKLSYFPHFNGNFRRSLLKSENRIIEGFGYSITFCSTHPNFKKDYLKVENYDGKIWCLKIEDNKNFIIERNGKLCICGNTDEVYGQAEKDGPGHKEWDVILPSNVYSASKAAQEAACISYWRTYDVPLVLTNMMNAVGEWQDKEKFLPKLIYKIATDQTMEIYGDVGNIGSRFYIHCKNIADSLIFISKLKPSMYSDGAPRPERYNVVGDMEMDNLQVAQFVAAMMGKRLHYKLIPCETARKGYDKRYALDGSKLAALGWKHPLPTLQAIEQIVQWTMKNPHWVV